MSDAPSLPQEIEDRTAQREAIERLFRARPLQEIRVVELRDITPHYQQRISEARRGGMDIRNVPVFTERLDGTKKRLDGNYKFHPTPGSREGTQPSAELWPVPDSPFADSEKFELT